MKLKLLKLPNQLRWPKLNIEPIRKIASFLFRHKVLITSLVCVIAFITVAMWYRGYLLSKMKQAPGNSGDEIFNSTPQDNQIPTIAVPSPADDNSGSNNSGSYNSNSYDNTIPTPFPTLAPLPTIAPYVAPATTTSTSSSGNSNCNTGSGTPNSWYSDVYPNPPATTNTGSMTLLIYIRDCSQNTAPVSDNLTITLTSNDSTAKINGSASPVTVQTQNGYASFVVSSQNTTTDTFTVQDTTSNFAVTDIKNNNPSVTFSGSSGSSGSGNSSCTTGSGTVNSWYSDVYPPSSTTVNTGSSATFTVTIRDCNRNAVSNDNLTISQTSSDSSFSVNGNNAPVTIQASNGQASFNVSSQNAGTDTFTIHDDTNNFTVTDVNNNNPSITFSGSSSAPTSTPTPTPTSSQTPSDTPTPTPITTPSPTGS